NLSWFFDRCDGSFCVDDVVMFWRGFRLERYGNLQPILEEVQSLGRISLGEPPEEAPAATSSSPTKRSTTAQQTRAFSTSARPGARAFQSASGRPRTYVTKTNPNPPLGKKNITKDKPARVALIGARGY